MKKVKCKHRYDDEQKDAPRSIHVALVYVGGYVNKKDKTNHIVYKCSICDAILDYSTPIVKTTITVLSQ